jgi:hypothetical protein
MIRDQMSLRFVTRRPVSDLTSDMGRNFAVAFPARVSLQPRCRLAVELPYPVGGFGSINANVQRVGPIKQSGSRAFFVTFMVTALRRNFYNIVSKQAI